MLDAGADGIVLAGVRDAAAAKAAVARTRHPPDGVRGWGPRRLASRRRRHRGNEPQQRPSVWAQIESSGAVGRAGEIAAVPGIDALVAGTADLSFSLGVPLDLHAPPLLEAVATIRRAAESRGIAHGVAGVLDGAPAAARDGASILVHATDARLCAAAVDAAAGWLR
jgi:4-hydroxy-2-oxoheptanedioate aldolase